ncbi:potassium channel family protein [Nocardioides aurantiacus]|uniref:Ion channel n=1 Tax=Nocardioides aurantiacus TaxID=86796 RepID=A0A3N2CQI4_9ACTN|nr:potassium channel family protein [Nocardioides aurantiacus]ROR89782.1 ion channel [Nocardioides aurantiacus]
MAVKRVLHRVVNEPRLLLAVLVADFLVASGLYWAIEGTGPVASMWWAIVTGTTTGYGDYSPVTTAGRGVAVLFMLSMLLLVLCAGAHFTRAVLHDPDAFTDAEQREMLGLLRENNALLRLQVEHDHGPQALERALELAPEQAHAPVHHPRQQEHP